MNPGLALFNHWGLTLVLSTCHLLRAKQDDKNYKKKTIFMQNSMPKECYPNQKSQTVKTQRHHKEHHFVQDKLSECRITTLTCFIFTWYQSPCEVVIVHLTGDARKKKKHHHHVIFSSKCRCITSPEGCTSTHATKEVEILWQQDSRNPAPELFFEKAHERSFDYLYFPTRIYHMWVSPLQSSIYLNTSTYRCILPPELYFKKLLQELLSPKRFVPLHASLFIRRANVWFFEEGINFKTFFGLQFDFVRRILGDEGNTVSVGTPATSLVVIDTISNLGKEKWFTKTMTYLAIVKMQRGSITKSKNCNKALSVASSNEAHRQGNVCLRTLMMTLKYTLSEAKRSTRFEPRFMA
ncbi:hypothetical protein H5410_005897 [Solanum commersonii]|uniref:Uncharacterized protein n=1 Tax=Solanum commersonii TaxID=4109 RepID=A0A9J6A9N2_SOLCO|nr:hypothetical protein H5410_005897 [Solanum commersonii]